MSEVVTLKRKPKLRVVEPTDIAALIRAEADDPKRWERVMIASDKSKPINLPDRVRRLWLR